MNFKYLDLFFAKNINDDSLVNLKDIKTLKLRYNDNITDTGLSFIKGV